MFVFLKRFFYKHFVLLLLVPAFLFRLFLLPIIASWGHDNSRDAILLYKLFEYRELIWRGPVFSVIWGFLSPAYYYLYAPFFYITNFHPLTSASITLVVNFFTLVIMYFVVKKMYGLKVAIISTFLYAFSFRIMLEGAYGLNPNLLPPFILVSFISLYKLNNTKKPLYFYLLSFCLGGLISFHPSGFFVFTSVLIYLFSSKPKFALFIWLKSFLIFFITGILPYLVVEKKFNFWNTNQVFKYLTGEMENSNEKINWLLSLLNYVYILLKNISLMFFDSVDSPYFIFTLLIVLLVLYCLLTTKRSRNTNFLYVTTGLSLLLMGISINYKPSQFLEPWVFNSILPLLLIVISINLSKLPNLILYLSALFFITINAWRFMQYTPPLDSYITSKNVSKYLLENSEYKLFDVYGTDAQPINYMVWYYAPEEFKEQYFTKVKWTDPKKSEIVYYLRSYDSSIDYKQKINEILEKRNLNGFELVKTVNSSVEIYKIY